MPDIDEKINELERRLDELIRTQISFQEKTSQIRYEIAVLRSIQEKRKNPIETERRSQEPSTYRPPQAMRSEPTDARPMGDDKDRTQDRPFKPAYSSDYEPLPSFGSASSSDETGSARSPNAFSRFTSGYVEAARANLEEFIGENLISKIGIAVLLLGIGIGVKYAIDNDLISPLTRIILGYIFGFGLIGFAIRLKPKYLNFSAVLLSGGMASMYFVTYFAFASYGLLGRSPAFALMAMFTVFTVAAALIYDRQAIAHIGLVGAYAVPFLLSSDSGAYAFLFTYMTIVNVGILAISIKRDWRPVIYAASGFTWLIFSAWFLTRYSAEEHFSLALIFLWLFFAIFYASNVILTRRDEPAREKSGLITAVATVGVFYLLLLGIADTALNTIQYIGLFAYLAAATAVIQITAKLRPLEIAGAHRLVFYVASGFAWATVLNWFAEKYSPAEHFVLGLIVVGAIFAIFYVTALFHAVSRGSAGPVQDLVSAIVTTLIFFGFCFGISDLNSGDRDIAVLFSYLAVFSVAILITAYRFYGRFLVLVSYPFTWLIYGSWFVQHYSADSNLGLAATFAAVFFVVYYLTTLAYRLVSDRIGLAEHAGLLLTNSFIFYGFGYAILDGREDLRGFQGLFTAAHGLFHLLAAQVVSRTKQNASDVVQVMTVLVITFLTLAIPVQLDGNHVTMAWAVESALLFWLARVNNIKLFEYFSFPVAILATGSLLVDWSLAFNNRTYQESESDLQVFANGNFVTALVFLAAFASIFAVNRRSDLRSTIADELVRPIGYIVAAIWLFVLYNTFRIEIDNYHYLQAVSALTNETRSTATDVYRLNALWQIVYSMLFFSVLNLVNMFKLRSEALGLTALAISVLSVVVYVLAGTVLFGQLQHSYLAAGSQASMNIGIRYFTYAAAAFLFYSLHRARSENWLLRRVSRRAAELEFDGLLSISVLVLASGELINLMIQVRAPDSQKYGLSVLWGVYALALIAVGIRKWKKHLRIGAMVLLGVTLFKLFFYDIADLPTIPKTLLFISLGILLLIISFLYTKYKYVIFGEPKSEEP